MTTIPGTPEGQLGVWLITPETAAQLIHDARGDQVHAFLGHNLLIGADWSKDDALEFLGRGDLRIALVFPPNDAVRHQLVAIDDSESRRFAFDIGVIGEERMVASEGDGL